MERRLNVLSQAAVVVSLGWLCVCVVCGVLFQSDLILARSRSGMETTECGSAMSTDRKNSYL